MKELDIQNQVRLALSELGAVTFRNNTGAYKDPRGYFVRFGLCQGSSDLIGWLPWRGQAVFLAVEVKSAKGTPTSEQINFIEQVKKAGGIAGIVRSADDARRLVEDWKAQNLS